MGMYDNLLLEIECPECKTVKIRGVQTKVFECLLSAFHVDDVVDASIKEIKAHGITVCDDCDIWIEVNCNIKDFKLTDKYEITSTSNR